MVTRRDAVIGSLGAVVGGIIILVLQGYFDDQATLVGLLLVVATVALVAATFMHAEATRVAMFVEAALSLYSLLEQPTSRSDRKRVYEEATILTGQNIADNSGLQEVVDRVAASFDYVNRLADGDDRLRDLAIKFYGVPAIRSWAAIKPYVKHMIKPDPNGRYRRPPNFHEAFRNFAEMAAKDPQCGNQPGINNGHCVHIDVKGETHCRSIWDEEDRPEPSEA